jgi:hypothetical protein
VEEAPDFRRDFFSRGVLSISRLLFLSVKHFLAESKLSLLKVKSNSLAFIIESMRLSFFLALCWPLL